MEDTQASQCHQAPPTPPAGVIDGDGNCAVFKGKEAERSGMCSPSYGEWVPWDSCHKMKDCLDYAAPALTGEGRPVTMVYKQERNSISKIKISTN